MEGSENNPEDMSTVANKLAKIAGVTEYSIVAIHHTPKNMGGNTDATPRGHGSIIGKSRSQILLTRKRGERGRIHQTKANEKADDVKDKGYHIRSVVLGKDFKNRDLSVGVFEPCDVLEEAKLPEGTHKHTSEDIGTALGLKKTARSEVINELKKRDILEQHGKGRSTFYTSTLLLPELKTAWESVRTNEQSL